MRDSPSQTLAQSPAILLAAGFGTRMAPLSDETPKPLISVGGTPLIDSVIEAFVQEGICQFVVNAHYRADQVMAHVTARAKDISQAKFVLSHERDAILDTGGGAKKALSLISGDPVFLSNTDAFWPVGSDTPLARMREMFEQKGGIVLLCARPDRATGFHRSHDFCLAPDGAVTNDRGLPVIFAGVSLWARSVFDKTPDGPFSFLDLLYEAQSAGQLFGVLLDAPWLHVGDPAAIKAAEAVLDKMRR